MQPYIIALIAVGAVLIALFAFAALTYHFAFGRRYDKNPSLKYFTANDFDLSAENVSLPKGLNGIIYRPAQGGNRNLVVFCHGMGPGHIAYTTEIAYFCNLGYTVLAVDGKGCGLSEGKSIGGMYSGVKTAISAVDYAELNLNYDKIYLVGHSWGAYSALCASAKRSVNAVVAISAPNFPAKTLQSGAAQFISKPFAAILRPFWWIINILKYGAKGNSSAARCAKKNNTPTLIVHGDSDKVVAPSNAVYYKTEGKNITGLLSKGKAHNPYNTQNAENCLAQLSEKLGKGEDVTDFDFGAATEEDAEVMQSIAKFIENN